MQILTSWSSSLEKRIILRLTLVCCISYSSFSISLLARDSEHFYGAGLDVFEETHIAILIFSENCYVSYYTKRICWWFHLVFVFWLRRLLSFIKPVWAIASYMQWWLLSHRNAIPAWRYVEKEELPRCSSVSPYEACSWLFLRKQARLLLLYDAIIT